MHADAPLPPQIWAWSDKARLVLDEAYPHMLLDDETVEALGKKTERERARATFWRDIVTSRCLTRRSERLEKIAKAAADYKPLSIDDSLLDLSKSKRPPRLTTPLLYAKCAARRALEIGYYEVLRVRRAMNDLKASGFDVIERTAENAEAVTDRFIKQLVGRSFKGRARELEIPILILQTGLQKGSPQELHAKANRDAMALLRAREIAQRLAKAAKQKRIATSPGRGKPVSPDHSAFLLPLAEVWVHITGRRPGSNTDNDTNPFLRFATSAWADVFGPKEELDAPHFISALRNLPDLSDYRLSQLKSEGPSWL